MADDKDDKTNPTAAGDGNGASQGAGAAGAGAAAGAVGAGAAAGNGEQPRVNVLAQYIKDFSFESPGAPASLRQRDKAPSININVNVNANPIQGAEYEVILTLNAKASDDNAVLFNAELVYGGVFKVEGFKQEHMLPILFIECPRLLFPFARQVIADSTRQGGFPPLMIDPIDFTAMFQQRIQKEQEAKAKVQVT